MTRGQRRLRDAIEVLLPTMLPFMSRSLGRGLLRGLDAFLLGPSVVGFGIFDNGIVVIGGSVKLPVSLKVRDYSRQ